MGADFKRISTGDAVITSSGQTITVLGYSSDPMEVNDAEKELVYKQHVTQHFENEKQSLIGLFYDQNAKDRQEIIVCPAFDVKPIIDLNTDKVEQLAKLSPLMDEKVAVHLLSLVMAQKEAESGSPQSVGNISQLNLRVAIMKSISFMIEALNKDFF